jgi:DNA-binding transcriptional MerR regulator
MSNLTQIALDFGQEPQAPPPEPTPAPAVSDREGEVPVRPYMAAGGVGVRIKAYKQTPTPQNGELFGGPPPAEIAAKPDESAAPAPPMVVPATTGVVAAEPAIEELAEAAEPEPAIAAEPEPAAAPEAPVAAEAPVEHVEHFEAPVIALREPTFTPAPDATTATPAPKRGPAKKRPAAAKKGPSKRGRKSLKQVAAEADLIEIPEDEVLFSKQYYTMGEVSEMFHVNQSLLRFWETEFDILQPRKNKKGDRYFRPIDIKHLHLIYHLLRQKKYTIEGAKEFLKNNKKAEERFEIIQRLQQIKAFLQEMKAQL